MPGSAGSASLPRADMSVAVIINPVSGGARRSSAEQRARIAVAGGAAQGDTADVLVSERTGHVRELTRAAVARGARLVNPLRGDAKIRQTQCALVVGQPRLA